MYANNQPAPSAPPANSYFPPPPSPLPPAPFPANHHPPHQQSATAGDPNRNQYFLQGPYVQNPPSGEPRNGQVESVIKKFQSWGSKAGTTTQNVWHNLKTGPSLPDSALGKVSLTMKAISEGGFESLYKQKFPTFPGETLKKTFACHLSTTYGSVAGTLYLSNAHVAFCSDRRLPFGSPGTLQPWDYYKVMLPLGKIGAINAVATGHPTDKWIRISTVDGHDFLFTGFVNHEKACLHLLGSLSTRSAPAIGIPLR